MNRLTHRADRATIYKRDHFHRIRIANGKLNLFDAGEGPGAQSNEINGVTLLPL